MYQTHFGLKRALFESGVAQDAAVFLAPKHEQIIASTKVALTTLDSAVVITGTAGVGKTTLMASALRTTSTRLALGWITGTPLNGAELLELLLVEFGFNAHRVGRVERMQMWRQFLNEMSATESRVFVIVERADDLNHEVLRALDSLTAADPNGGPGANLVLLGQPALLDHLKAPMLESLRQRIRWRERLEPFTSDELREYLVHQMTRVGGQLDKVFAPNAVATLHKLSGGIPRIANNLSETALTLAATGKESLVTSELLTRIAVAMFGIEAPISAGTEPTLVRTSAPAATPAATPVAAAAPAATPTAPLIPAAPSAASPAAAAAPAAPAATPAPVAARAPATLETVAPIVVSRPLVSASFTSSPAVAFAPLSAPTYTLPPARTESAAPIALDPPAPIAAVIATATKPAITPVVAPIVTLTAAADAAKVVLPTPAPPNSPTLPPFNAPLPDASTPVPRADPPIATRSSDTSFAKPAPERSARPIPAPLLASSPPFARGHASPLAGRTEFASEIDSFADTLTDSPDVQMPDLPVLTDAVEPATRMERPRARAEMAYARPDPGPAARIAVAAPPSAMSMPTAPSSRAAAPAPIASAPRKPAPSPAPKPVPGAPKLAVPEVSEEDLLHQTQTVRALAAAKSIDDISNSMAETLFGEADLDMLSAALASAGWSETSDADTVTPVPPPANAKPTPQAEARTAAQRAFDAEQDPFDFLGLGHDAPLELIDDSPPLDDANRKTANRR